MYEHNGKWFFSLRAASFAAFFVLIVGFGCGFLISAHAADQTVNLSNSTSEPSNVDYSPVWKAWNILNQNFVPDAVATSTPLATTTAGVYQDEVWGMISGMADSLNDPYTFFLPPQQNTDFSSSMSGSFGGIGMQIDVKNGVLTVVSPLKGTPAEAAGIKSGDQVLTINGTPTTGMDVSTAVDDIRGPSGTTVTLSIMRSGWSAPQTFTITRAIINVPIVTSTTQPGGIYVITVTQFTSNAPELFRDALRTFVQSTDNKLILDLRGNPGGYLDAAVNMASWFLPSGDVIVTEDYDGHQANVVHRSFGYNIFNNNLKMVVLVDQGSASASEIFADALRYYGVAKLVGTNTFGKGVVQELFPITDTTSLKVTVARWLGPDGLQIPHTGIIPDVMATTSDAAIAAGDDPQMQAAIKVLNGN
ncbi:MAG TPA: S41 family peptidase [Candidatus Paceibacterota bacterium]|nr:S41 family peptidase [Candidatus Paceibacterota bacterium]